MKSSMVLILCLILWISTGSLTYFFCCIKYAKKAALRSLYPSILSRGSSSNHTLAVPIKVFTLLGIRVFRELLKLRIRGVNGSTSSHDHGTAKSSSIVGLRLFEFDFQCPPSLVPLSDTRDNGDSLSSLFSCYESDPCHESDIYVWPLSCRRSMYYHMIHRGGVFCFEDDLCRRKVVCENDLEICPVGRRCCAWQNVHNADDAIFLGQWSELNILSHLFYADDAIFLGQWSELNIDSLVRVLDYFFRASGLRINVCKSKIMGVNVEDGMVKNAASKLGCLVLKTPFTYLGTKVRGNISRKQAWK
ncbi:hypothetical protein Tco_1086428, partial [Tanacetum coccineum]